MKKEIADKWIADLRTNPPQATGALFNGKGYCCLGRLCVVLGYQTVARSGKFYIQEDDMELPSIVVEEAGMVSSNGVFYSDEACLAELNDAGKTFSEIADVIEAEWERL